MTETSPIVATNALHDNDPATIGRPLDGVEVRIADNQELQVRGRSVMQGYWKREADTVAAFTDGWLRTGDQAAIEHGRLRILEWRNDALRQVTLFTVASRVSA